MSDSVINSVRKVCKNRESCKALAVALGYKSANTLDAWAKKGKIPSWKMQDVKEKLATLAAKPSAPEAAK